VLQIIPVPYAERFCVRIDEYAVGLRKNPDINGGDVLIERSLADIERWLQPLQEGLQFGGCKSGPQWRSDRAQPETRIVSHEKFGAICHVERNSVARSDTACG
jgi:hypothetical protein